MLKANEKWGTLPLSALIEPAIVLARDGFAITAMQADNYNRLRKVFIEQSSDSLDIPLIKADRW